jgi:hypothetical protein
MRFSQLMQKASYGSILIGILFLTGYFGGKGAADNCGHLGYIEGTYCMPASTPQGVSSCEEICWVSNENHIECNKALVTKTNFPVWDNIGYKWNTDVYLREKALLMPCGTAERCKFDKDIGVCKTDILNPPEPKQPVKKLFDEGSCTIFVVETFKAIGN